MSRTPAFWLDVAVKLALVGLLAFGAFSGLDQFEGKAFGWRLATYPLAAVIVPAGWHLARRPPPYPYALDTLVAPFLVDVIGNALDFYDIVMVVGAGAVAAILWELAEYVAFIRNSPELTTAYEDTLADMALGLGGATVAALATVTLLRPRSAL